MSVLVTGGSGAIGRHVVGELVDRGHDVRVYDLREPDVRGATFVEGNVTDAEAVATAVSDADAVVNMAALLPHACGENPRAAMDVNVGGVQNVLEAASGTDTRVVYVSSKAAFGHVTGRHAHPTYEPLGADAPMDPVTMYGVTKRSGELQCEWYAAERDVEVTSVRFGATYGPGQGERYGNLAVVSGMIETAANGGTVRLSGGDQREGYVYLLDIARGVADAVETETWNFPAYHISSEQLVTLRDFADVLRAECADTDIRIESGLDYRNDTHPSYCRLDVSRAKADLGFDPKYPLEEGVRHHLSPLD